MANFKPSSFIPKEPLKTDQPQRSSGGSPRMNIFLLTGNIVAVFALLFAGGVFGYDYYISNQLSEKKAALSETQSSFEPELIQELIRLDERMKISKKLLDNHIAVTPVMRLLEQETIRSVQVTNFTYTDSEEGGEITGIARADGYGAIALQSDAFMENENIQESQVSDFSVISAGQQSAEEQIEFQFELIIPKNMTNYKNTLEQS